MKIKKAHLSLLLIVFFQSSVFLSVNAQITKSQDGILLKVGNQQIRLLTVNNGAFCISLNDSATPSKIKSVFIDASKHKHIPYTVIAATPLYGIKTSYGKLLVNTTTQLWSLYDAAGQVLIRDGSYATTATSIQISYTAKGLLYGSGNKTSKDLEKNQGDASAGNGVSDIPYYWDNTGYCALGISANDNSPSSWKRSTKDGTLTWNFSGKAANLYLWTAKTLYNALAGYTSLTGKPKLPPRWAFGYLQSRWGWEDSAYISNVLHRFRADKLPVDAFIFDFEWFTKTPDYSLGKNGKAGYTDFMFNPKLFPHPAKQLAELHSQGVKFIGIRKPRLGNAAMLDTAREKDWLISPNSDSRDLNFSIPGLQNWYEAKNRPLIKAGVDAWWDDEGESYYTCYYWWNKTQRDLLASARPDYRHFAINRSFSPGNQRLGYCTWSGDIPSTWSSLANVPRDLLNFSLAGMYYGACDIGGFQGTPTKEMLVRWFQAGVFLPIMRAHSTFEVLPRFPYLWGKDGEAAIRKALDLRYQLLPFIYSLGHEAYRTGAPIMRPLVMEFPKDTAVTNMTDEWLLGKGVLAAPILDSGGRRTIYFPDDTWYDYFTGDVIKGSKTISVDKTLSQIPLYVRAGTILPIGPVIQYSEQISETPLEIRIYPGKNGSFKMFEDDGTSYNYMKGKTRVTSYIWNDQSQTLSWKVSDNYSDKHTYKTIKVLLGKREKLAKLGKEGSISFK